MLVIGVQSQDRWRSHNVSDRLSVREFTLWQLLCNMRQDRTSAFEISKLIEDDCMIARSVLTGPRITISCIVYTMGRKHKGSSGLWHVIEL